MLSFKSCYFLYDNKSYFCISKFKLKQMQNSWSRTNNKDYIILFVFSFVFCFLFLQSSPFYAYNAAFDPNIYFSMGKGWINGFLPYRDTFEQKGPVLYLIYGIGYLLSNTDFVGVYLIQCLFMFTNVLFAYKISLFFVSKGYSYFIALLYPGLLSFMALEGGSAEEFVSTFQTIGLYLYLSYILQFGKKYKSNFFLQGLLIGLVFMLKFNLILFWLPLLSVLFIKLLFNKKIKIFFIGLGFLILGILTILVPFLIYFELNQGLDDFIFCYFTFNISYSVGNTVPSSFLLTHFLNYFKYHWLIFSLVLVGVITFVLNKNLLRRKVYGIGIILSFLIVYCMVLPSVHPYYYVSIYVFGLLGLIAIATLCSKRIDIRLNIFTGILAILLGLLLGFNAKRGYFIRGKEKQKEALSLLLEDIKKEQNPTVLHLGLNSVVATYADVMPTLKYFFYPNIPYEDVPLIRDQQDSYIINKQVDFVLSYSDSQYYNNHYKDFEPLLENYTLIKTVYDESETRFYYLYKVKE